jgi:RNA polymerase sigma-70 factor (ECF subfamily)
MTADPPDREVVRRVLAGDRESFALLYDRYARLVLAVVADADLAQETFLRAFRGLGSLRDPDRPAPWLVGIARQVASEARRRRPWAGLPDDLPGRPEPSADDADEVAHLRHLVSQLPADQQEAVRLFFLSERDVHTTARLLGRSRSGTYLLLQTAVATLARWLAADHPAGEAKR